MTALLLTYLLVIACGVAFTISLLAPVVLVPLLQKRGVVDVPNARSSHTTVAVRGLGIGVFCGIFAAWIVVLLLDPSPAAWLLFAAVNMFALVGLLEDVKGLSVRARSVAQLTITACAVLLSLRVADPEIPFWARVLVAIFGLFYVSSFVNVANFMDGLNGISALHGIIAGAAFVIIGLIYSLDYLFLMGAVSASAFLAFLPWNLAGRGFLGDIGSYLLGGVIITSSFYAMLSGVFYLAAISPTIIYFGDVGWTMLQRIRRGAKVSEAHKEHVYQRLQQSGLTHLQASAVPALCTVAAVVLGIISIRYQEPWQQALFLAAGFSVVVIYTLTPRLRR